MKSKERFIKAMTALKAQYDKDIAYAKDVSNVLVVDMAPYNNSEVVNIIVDELASWFHDPEEAKEEINRFMYDQQFGKHETRSQQRVFINLWNKLNMPWINVSATGMHNSDPFGNYHDY